MILISCNGFIPSKSPLSSSFGGVKLPGSGIPSLGSGNSSSGFGNSTSGLGNLISRLGIPSPGSGNSSSGFGNSTSGLGNLISRLGIPSSGSGNSISDSDNFISDLGNPSSGSGKLSSDSRYFFKLGNLFLYPGFTPVNSPSSSDVSGVDGPSVKGFLVFGGGGREKSSVISLSGSGNSSLLGGISYLNRGFGLLVNSPSSSDVSGVDGLDINELLGPLDCIGVQEYLPPPFIELILSHNSKLSIFSKIPICAPPV